MKRASCWSWLSVVLSAAMLAVMLLPGSYSKVMGHWPNYHYDYTAFIGKEQGGIMGWVCFALGLLLVLVSLNGAMSERKGIVSTLSLGLALLFFIAGSLSAGSGHWLPLVPPVLAIASMVTAFVAWRKSKSE